MALVFPYPQTAGRERHINIVDQSTFDGLPFRPTATQAESLFRTDVYAGNDWYGTPFELQFSEQANIEESRAKAAEIGGEAGGGFFADLWKTFKDTTVKTVATIADQFVDSYKLRVQSYSPGSPVPGSPPAPAEINLTAAQREQIIKERIEAGKGILQSLVAQIKGLFNLGYPSPAEPPSPTPEEMGYPISGETYGEKLPISPATIAILIVIWLMVR